MANDCPAAHSGPMRPHRPFWRGAADGGRRPQVGCGLTDPGERTRRDDRWKEHDGFCTRHGRWTWQERCPEARIEPCNRGRRLESDPDHACLRGGAVREGRPVVCYPDLRVLRDRGRTEPRRPSCLRLHHVRAPGRCRPQRSAQHSRQGGTLQAWSRAVGTVMGHELFRWLDLLGNLRPSGRGRCPIGTFTVVRAAKVGKFATCSVPGSRGTATWVRNASSLPAEAASVPAPRKQS